MGLQMNLNYELLDENDVPKGVMLPEEGWALRIEGCIVAINWVKFGEEENPDGSFPLEINYDILEGTKPKGFDNIVGDLVIDIIEDSFKIKEMKAMRKEAEENR